MKFRETEAFGSQEIMDAVATMTAEKPEPTTVASGESEFRATATFAHPSTESSDTQLVDPDEIQRFISENMGNSIPQVSEHDSSPPPEVTVSKERITPMNLRVIGDPRHTLAIIAEQGGLELITQEQIKAKVNELRQQNNVNHRLTEIERDPNIEARVRFHQNQLSKLENPAESFHGHVYPEKLRILLQSPEYVRTIERLPRFRETVHELLLIAESHQLKYALIELLKHYQPLFSQVSVPKMVNFLAELLEACGCSIEGEVPTTSKAHFTALFDAEYQSADPNATAQLSQAEFLGVQEQDPNANAQLSQAEFLGETSKNSQLKRMPFLDEFKFYIASGIILGIILLFLLK